MNTEQTDENHTPSLRDGDEARTPDTGATSDTDHARRTAMRDTTRAAYALADMSSRALSAYVAAYCAHVRAGSHDAAAQAHAKKFALTMANTAAEITMKFADVYLSGKLDEATIAALEATALEHSRG